MGKIFRMNRKAVSPVIATIILVAIAIAIAIAVAYWMVGITGAFTRFEKLEVSTAYAEVSGTNFVVTCIIKNSGSAAATIDDVYINGKPYGKTTATVAPDVDTAPATLNPGDVLDPFTITMPIGTDFKSGMTVEITLHTVAGKEYPKQVVLP